MSTLPNSKRNLKPSSTSASSAQPSFATARSPLQGMSQPTDQTSPYAAAAATPAPQSSSATNPRKRRASGQPNPQMTPSPIAPAPMPTSSTFAESSGHPAPTQDSNQQPPAKKGRTNTPWTPAEELRLKHMRDAGKSWSEIAKSFPQRTEGSVKKHWYKDMHYAEFAEDESAALLAAIKEYEANKWKTIGAKVGKPAKACEQYAKEHFGGKM